MGNRIYLHFGSCSEFEANHILPVTWLALFSPQDFLVETRQEESEEFEVAIYRTSRSLALAQAEKVIAKLKRRTPIWAFLRPIEILRDELVYCSSAETIEVDLTQFWAKNEDYEQRIIQVVSDFSTMMDNLTGNEQQDLTQLDQLVNRVNNSPISTVADLNAEEKMFVLIGTYWGDEKREGLYSFEYFDDTYWGTTP